MSKDISIIVLAAGKGERMKSQTPKVLHKICGRPMIGYVLDLVNSLKPKQSVFVLGYKHELVRREIPKVSIAIQNKLVGTADAVKVALGKLKGPKGMILVLYGDIPLLKKESIDKLIKFHKESSAAATLLTAKVSKPKGYGRILRDKYFSIRSIVEEKDADDFEKEIKEVNTGIICFDKKSLKAALKKVKANNKKKEYYLTDVISILYTQGKLIEGVKIDDINEAMGINSRLDLAKANNIMRLRINDKIMFSGVTIVDPASTFINFGTKIGPDTVIYPFTVIESDVRIGKRCSVGPFAHLREGARINDEVTLGNFLEVVRASIGKNTFAKHFCYIADSKVGNSVNIGAGSVTANFDGVNKHNTVIKDRVLIGSDTIIVAPVKIGKGAKTGAGAVVIRDIPEKKTAVGVPARILKK
jgi:bifunctional UDP-N-acetylglucosamine pyrophosphorylase/glucosamine-1-phosphate N-acetyltransferase